MTIKEWLNEYLSALLKDIENLPIEIIKSVIDNFGDINSKKRQIFVFGNGGSAANASHFVTDLGKGASDKTKIPFKCISLNECNSLITALGNDYNYEDIYVRQLMNFSNHSDIVFVMSVSGNSPNLVKAVEWANKKGMETIALVGKKKGKLGTIAKQVITVESEHYGRVEDMHMLICHLIAYAFMEHPEWTQ